MGRPGGIPGRPTALWIPSEPRHPQQVDEDDAAAVARCN